MHLLLLPGMDGTGQLFDPLLRILPPSVPATVVGYPTDRPLSYNELLPVVSAAVPDAAEFVVLGESFSGPLALMLAARNPPGLRGVILSASFARSPLPAFIRCFRVLVHPLWFRAAPNALVDWALLGRHATAPLRGMLRAASAHVRPEVMADRAQAVITVDVAAELQACAVPLLYLRGTEDRIVSPRSLAHIRRLRADVAEATVDAPHLLLQAAPEAAAAHILRFLASILSPNHSLDRTVPSCP